MTDKIAMDANSLAIIKRGMAALERIETDRNFDDWVQVGHAVVECRNVAMRQAGCTTPYGRAYTSAYATLMDRYGFAEKLKDKSDRAKLVALMENLPAIMAWRQGLEPGERQKITHPTAVWRNWQRSQRIAAEAARPRPATAAKPQARAAKAEPGIDPATLSPTAQQKLEIAIRQEKQKLAASFEQRVRDEIKTRIDEIVLPHWKKQIAEAQTLYSRRRGLMTKEVFNTIRRGLHPDSRNAISDKKLGEAFDAFMALEKYLLDEKSSPTQFGDLPDNLADWDKMRAKRPARRNGKQQPAMRS